MQGKSTSRPAHKSHQETKSSYLWSVRSYSFHKKNLQYGYLYKKIPKSTTAFVGPLSLGPRSHSKGKIFLLWFNREPKYVAPFNVQDIVTTVCLINNSVYRVRRKYYILSRNSTTGCQNIKVKLRKFRVWSKKEGKKERQLHNENLRNLFSTYHL